MPREFTQDEAIKHLNSAKECWLKRIDRVEKCNVSVMPYQFDLEYSWQKQLPLVDKDIDIVKQ